MNGSLAVAVLVILAFACFILWAKTPSGRLTLVATFGEPVTPTPAKSTRRSPVKRQPRKPAKRTKSPSR